MSSDKKYTKTPSQILSKKKCEVCPETENLVLHHIQPSKMGESENPNNLILLCYYCDMRATHGIGFPNCDDSTLEEKLRTLASEMPQSILLLEKLLSIFKARGYECKIRVSFVPFDITFHDHPCKLTFAVRFKIKFD